MSYLKSMSDELAAEVIAFDREHAKHWNGADPDKVREYFDWFYTRDLLGIGWDGPFIGALMSVRPFSEPKDYWKEFEYEPDGRYVQVRLYGATGQRFIAEAALWLARHHNPDRIFLWHRVRNEKGTPRMYSETQIVRMVRRLGLAIL